MSEGDISQLLLSLLVLLVTAHSFGFLFDKMKLPKVAGEIVGGILLGPSALAQLAPDVHLALFPSSERQEYVLSVFYWLGLITLMFVSGLKVDRSDIFGQPLIMILLLIGATVPSFLIGLASPHLVDLSSYVGPKGDGAPFILILSIAFAVSSIPVISKIFYDLNILESRFAKMVLSVAIIQDLVLWVALSFAISLSIGGSVEQTPLTSFFGRHLLFILIAFALGKYLLVSITDSGLNIVKKASPLGYLLAICLSVATLASSLSVNLVFGALVAGLLAGSLKKPELKATEEQISDVAMGFFVPVYFALVGFKVDLLGQFDLWFTFGFIVLSSIVQIFSVVIASRCAGLDFKVGVNFGIALNTRGGPGIVLASMALEAGIITQSLYVSFVVAAIVTSIFSGAWFRHLIAKRVSIDWD